VAVVGSGYYLMQLNESNDVKNILTEVNTGDFLIEITTTGELMAKNSIQISPPEGSRSARIYSVKIEDIVDEGTIVEKGDYVATLDKTELSERIRNEELDLEGSRTELLQSKLDTALDVRRARDQLAKAELDVKRKELTVQNSKYEPPATIQQAEFELREAEMNYEQAKLYFELTQQRAITQVREDLAELIDDEQDMEFLLALEEQFIIEAPESGMVIYTRDRRGRRIGKGSTISSRSPVALLPDLTKMISVTFVNEVDIRKVSKGQEVKIGLDAYPEKLLSGAVLNVANVGQQKPNSDAKVFEVEIEINQQDSTLRPAMTTSNTIVAEVITDVKFLPIETIRSLGDSLTYVFKKVGERMVRQEVKTGKANSNDIIIEAGLNVGDEVLLSQPVGLEETKLVLLENESLNVNELSSKLDAQEN